MFDPFITGNENARAISIDNIHADYIFVSHGHTDHILDAVAIAKRTGALVTGSFELYTWFMAQGITNTRPLNPGGKAQFEFGMVKSTAAIHSSSFHNGGYAGVAAGFIFKTGEGNFYYSGDTGLTLDMTLVPKWAKLDFAVLPIGDVLTMGADDAAEAAKLVEVQKVVGVHYSTFGFININTGEAKQTFAGSGLTLYLPAIGETIDV